MKTFSEFLNMGGYAFYVWMSYGIALIVLTIDFIWPRITRKSILQSLKYSRSRREKLAKRNEENTQ